MSNYGQPYQNQQQNQPQQQHAYPSEPIQPTEHKQIMDEQLFGCFNDLGSCLMAFCLPCCVMGSNIQETNQGSFIYGCCLFGCCFPCMRSSIQRALGVQDAGCIMNCCIYSFCGVCALAQETRAVKKWIAVGKPSPFPGHNTMSM